MVSTTGNDARAIVSIGILVEVFSHRISATFSFTAI
jgi:hypothetical protein